MPGRPLFLNPTQNPITVPAATSTTDGAMSSTDKVKLDSLVAGTLSAVKTSDYTASIGETVRVNPTGGPVAITLPPLGNPARDVTVLNVTGSTNFITVLGALAQLISTTGSITSGTNSLSVADSSPFVIGQSITVAGAGVAGANLITTITGTGLGSVDLTANASTTVVGAAVTSVGRQSVTNSTGASRNIAYSSMTFRDCETLWMKIAVV